MAGNEAHNAAMKAERLGEAQKKMVDAQTISTLGTSVQNLIGEIREDKLYRDAEYNQMVQQNSQLHADKVYQQSLQKYIGEYEKHPEFKGSLEEFVAEYYPAE